MKTGAPENLPWYCFQSQYIDILLTQAYRFDPNTTWNSLHFVESVSRVKSNTLLLVTGNYKTIADYIFINKYYYLYLKICVYSSFILVVAQKV